MATAPFPGNVLVAARDSPGERAKTQSVKLRCPLCSKVVIVEDDFPARPFCSARCKLADLNNWLNGVYRINGESASDPKAIDETDSN